MKVLISLGPTKHYIDDVRFISNSSTGKFGYELAKEALLRRNKVRVVSGPINMLQIQGVEEWTWITTVDELKEAIEKRFSWADVIIMASAVLDFIPVKKIKGKIPRSLKKLDIKLKSTPDILKLLSKKKGRSNKIIVGVSLQDNNLIESSYSKLKEKNLDLIIAVPLKSPSFPYGNTAVSCVVLDKDNVERLPLWRKYRISEYIWNRIELHK